jgi:50S ribosomal protein L16 3-hydroxylase
MEPEPDSYGLFVGDITTEEFVRIYWRKKPLFIKNGAKDILSYSVTEKAFDDLVAELKATGTSQIKERDGEVTFVENLSQYMPELHLLATRYGALFGAPSAWFDGVRTYSTSGIGSHFDHSDNFVLQQTGVKHWTLSPPDVLPKADVARRMLNAPGIGSFPIVAANSVSFELEPGDFLYLPLFWVHSGVSKGASLSVSLVCPAVSFQAILIRGLQQVMIEQLIGHQAVPSFHPFFTAFERSQYSKTLQNVARTLLRKLSSDSVVQMIIDHQLNYLGVSKSLAAVSPETFD